MTGRLFGGAAAGARFGAIALALLVPCALPSFPSVRAACPGDVDGDGAVTVADYYALFRHMRGEGSPCAAADVDRDGRVGPRDFQRLLDFLLRGDPLGDLALPDVDTVARPFGPGDDNGGSDLEFVHFGLLARNSLAPGERDVEIPVWISAGGVVEGFRLSLRFDPEVVENVRVVLDPTIQRRALYSSVYRDRAGEGFVGVAALGPPTSSPRFGLLPVFHGHVADIVFDVRADAGDHAAAVFAFAPMPGGPFGNEVSVGGRLRRPREQVSFAVPIERPGAVFVRGDVTGDGEVDVGDAVATFMYLFRGQSLLCPDAADVDDDGRILLNDPIRILNHLFADGPPPSAPYPAEGPDPTEDHLPPCRL